MATSHQVVVGVDGSEAGATALAWAAREADRRHASLRVLHSYTVPVYAGDLMGGAAYLAADPEALHEGHVHLVEEQVASVRLAFPDLPVEPNVEVGSPSQSLVTASKAAEIVVTGSQGAGAASALFLGSVAHSVAHHALCPVALIPSAGSLTAITRVVVGTDGSAASAVAVAWAHQEAELWGAKLCVVHAWEYPYVEVGYPSGIQDDAAMVLTNATAALPTGGSPALDVEAKLVQGSPAMSLLEETNESDLLVVGARGRGALRSMLLGSTTSYAIHHARCPVVIVHAEHS